MAVCLIISTTEADEIVGTRKKIIDTYRANQADTFSHLDTVAAEWKPCDLLGEDEDGNRTYDTPEGYDIVFPYTERLTKEQKERLILQSMWDNELERGICELCGHKPIRHHCPIRHDKKRLLVFVGSECIDNFMGAGYVTKTINLFRENKARQLFRLWIPLAIEQCYKHKETDPSEIQFPGMLERKYFFFKKKLLKIKNADEDHVNELTSRKIYAIYRQAQRLDLKIPHTVEEAFRKKESKRKSM